MVRKCIGLLLPVPAVGAEAYSERTAASPRRKVRSVAESWGSREQPPGGEAAVTGRGDEAYLLGLRLRGKRVVVVGGGAVAARRVPRLLAAGADVLLISPRATPALEELAAANRIDWRSREYREGDCAGAWLVCACAGPPQVNALVAEEAERQRTWCVRADDGASSTAWT